MIATIAIAPGVLKPLEEIVAGERVLAAGPLLRWEPRTVLAVVEADDAGDDLPFQLRLPDRTLILTAGQLLLRADGSLTAVRELATGDRLREAGGSITTVVTVFPTQGRFALHHLSLGVCDAEHPLDGHLINRNGLVVADLALQWQRDRSTAGLAVTIAAYLDGEPMPPS